MLFRSNEGFWARSGSDFTARLDECGVVTSRLGSPNSQISDESTELLDQMNGLEAITMNAFPNPFSSVVKFGVFLPEDQQVKFAIYDMFGKQIATLADRELAAGKYVFDFNALNVSAGIYNAVLQTETKQLVQRIVRSED